MNILLTSVGRRSYMVSYFKEALKGLGNLHTANSIETYAMLLADKSVISPLIYDESYINFLLSYSIQHNIEAIIPLFDLDLPLLAKNKSTFAAHGIKVVVSEYATTQICNDKWLTYQFLLEHGFNTPKTYSSLKDCVLALKNAETHYPLIIKPRWGMGSIGIYQVDDVDELRVFYQKAKKDILNSYLKHESSLEAENSVLIQEKLLGEEYGLDIFNDFEGNFLTCIAKKKLEMRAGETNSAEITDNPALLDLGKQLSQSLHHSANLDVDCLEVNHQYYILELNCRFGGQYPFCHLAGANFPKAIINLLQGKEIEKELLEVQAGTIGYKDILPLQLKYKYPK